jgi:hypothetical protein
VVTVIVHVAFLPFDSVTVIDVVPAPTEVTVNVEPETFTLATFGFELVAVYAPLYEKSTAENACVSPVPLNESEDGINLKSAWGVGVAPGVGVGVGVGSAGGSEDGAAVGAVVGATLGAGVGDAADAGAAYKPR